ncbi:MAG TPA: DUF72 domain-containing protein [Chitinophagales bacterium]|nr:DUF72 domain-containing protein [Chitinophagales bacterium]
MKPKFNIGCSGFYNRHWKGIFYPDKLPQRRWFEFYAENFNTLELNTTFYRFPTAESLSAWYKKSPDSFLFCVKAPRLITHYKQFKDCARLIDDFYQACDSGLQDKLACTLFQMPPQFQYSEERLILLMESLNPGYKNVVEFRHESWWTKKVQAELAARNIVFCTVSHPKMPEKLVVNSPTVYVRLHGVPRMFYSDYSNEYLSTLYQSILKKKKVKEAFIFFNNTAGEAGILNAQTMREVVKGT